MSKQYQYTLNENAKDAKDKEYGSMQIEGFSFKRGVWLSHHSRILQLEKYIKTKNNTKGILDYREYRTDDNTVLFSSKDAFDEIPEKIYSFEELSLMDKRDLAKIANMYNISRINKTSKKLMKDILEMQQSILSQKAPE